MQLFQTTRIKKRCDGSRIESTCTLSISYSNCLDVVGSNSHFSPDDCRRPPLYVSPDGGRNSLSFHTFFTTRELTRNGEYCSVAVFISLTAYRLTVWWIMRIAGPVHGGRQRFRTLLTRSHRYG